MFTLSLISQLFFLLVKFPPPSLLIEFIELRNMLGIQKCFPPFLCLSVPSFPFVSFRVCFLMPHFRKVIFLCEKIILALETQWLSLTASSDEMAICHHYLVMRVLRRLKCRATTPSQLVFYPFYFSKERV